MYIGIFPGISPIEYWYWTKLLFMFVAFLKRLMVAFVCDPCVVNTGLFLPTMLATFGVRVSWSFQAGGSFVHFWGGSKFQILIRYSRTELVHILAYYFPLSHLGFLKTWNIYNFTINAAVSPYYIICLHKQHSKKRDLLGASVLGDQSFEGRGVASWSSESPPEPACCFNDQLILLFFLCFASAPHGHRSGFNTQIPFVCFSSMFG